MTITAADARRAYLLLAALESLRDVAPRLIDDAEPNDLIAFGEIVESLPVEVAVFMTESATRWIRIELQRMGITDVEPENQR